MSNGNNNDIKGFELKPTSGRTLRFKGKKLADVSGRWVSGQEQNRYTDLKLYKTTGGRYILWICYNTCWQGEQDCYTAHVCPTAADVYSHLENEEGELGRLDVQLLREAAQADPALEAVTVEEVE
jgi:hypothetical protein